jgi:hypothetical protein
MVLFISWQIFAVRVGSVVPKKDGGDQQGLRPTDRRNRAARHNAVEVDRTAVRNS